MNKHLTILIERAYNELELDFDYGTEHGDTETYFIIFHSWDDREKFVDMCKEYCNDNDMSDYQIEQEFSCELVFDDEYTLCMDCNSIIRTSADSYGWQPDFYVGDGFIVCGECFRVQEDYQEDYLQERINNPKNAVNGLLTSDNLEELGFTKVNEDSYENGYHYGQTDSPEDIYNELKEQYDEVVFFINSVGQFDIHFDVYVRGEVA